MDLLLSEGPRSVSIKRIATILKAPSGSVYHRFGSRDHLVAELWLNAVESFQSRFANAVVTDPAIAARDVVRWSRENREIATLLTRYRREDLMQSTWPKEVQDRARILAGQLDADFKELANRYPREKLMLAAVDIPKAAVKRYLNSNTELPSNLEDLVEKAARAVLA